MSLTEVHKDIVVFVAFCNSSCIVVLNLFNIFTCHLSQKFSTTEIYKAILDILKRYLHNLEKDLC